MNIRALVCLLLLPWLGQGAAGQFGYHLHPDTGEAAAITVTPFFGGGTPPGPLHVPILAIFPSGEVWLSVDYAEEKPPQYAGGVFSREEIRALRSWRLSAGSPFGQMPSGTADASSRDPAQGSTELAKNQAIFREVTEILNSLAYLRGTVEPGVVETLIDSLKSEEFHAWESWPMYVHGSHLTVTVHDGQYYETARAPYSYYFEQHPFAPIWSRQTSLEENWRNAAAHLFGIFDHVDPESLSTRIARFRSERFWISPVLRSEEALEGLFDREFAPPDTTPVNRHVATALEMADAGGQSPVLYLRSAMPDIPREEQYQAYQVIARLYLEAGGSPGAANALEKVADGRIPAPPAARADAHLRLGHIRYEEGPSSRALDHFARVATGLVPATREQLEEAAYHTARLLEQHRRGEDAARALYRHLEEHAPHVLSSQDDSPADAP